MSEHKGLPAGVAGEIMALKDPDAALKRCNELGYSEGWRIVDGAVVIYNIDDPPAWLPDENEDCSTGKSKAGVVYVEVRPDLTAFDAAVEEAVKRAEQRLARAVST